MKAKRFSPGRRLAFESLEDRVLLTSSAMSTNWSGYVTENRSAGSVTYVSGQWTVPTVTAPTSDRTYYFSQWVGIDGWNSSTVEQIGIGATAKSAGTSYYAWYEMYPSSGSWVTINTMTIKPGDSISASVTYVTSGTYAGKFLLSITNTTRSQSYSIYKTATASRSCAEWIVERPDVGGTTYLANFGDASFSNCKATISGRTDYFPYWGYIRITMTNNSGSVVLVVTTQTTSTGHFHMLYQNSGVSGTSAASSVATSLDSETVTGDATLASTLTESTLAHSNVAGGKLTPRSELSLSTLDLDLLGRTTKNLANFADKVFASLSDETELDLQLI